MVAVLVVAEVVVVGVLGVVVVVVVVNSIGGSSGSRGRVVVVMEINCRLKNYCLFDLTCFCSF